MKKDNKLTYSKSNELIQVRGQVIRRDPLTETKRKIIALEASKVQQNDTEETVYTVYAKEMIELCKIKKTGKLYEAFFNELFELKAKAIAFVNENGNISIESYMNNVIVDRKKGLATYTIPKALIPHFKMYAPFTKLDLLEYMPLKGGYALLLYELLMSWRKAGSVEYTLKDLRRLLEVPEKSYPRNADFLRYVIYSPLEQINERINGHIDYELTYGYRRQVESIKFTIDVTEKNIESLPSQDIEIKSESVEDVKEKMTYEEFFQQYVSERHISEENIKYFLTDIALAWDIKQYEMEEEEITRQQYKEFLEYPQYKTKEITEAVKEQSATTETRKAFCPECGGRLLQKINQKTKTVFWGCENYSKNHCTYAQDRDPKLELLKEEESKKTIGLYNQNIDDYVKDFIDTPCNDVNKDKQNISQKNNIEDLLKKLVHNKGGL